MTDKAFIVQFPHPGGEHRPKTDVMPWNTGSHRRKFMTTEGNYSDGSGSLKAGQLVFWGEFEGHSRVIARWEEQDPLPMVLHAPFLGTPPSGVVRQNTDPWVFGERFHYSNCKQLTNHESTVTFMQGLTDGSLVLFGSSVGGSFVLDTALVIAGKRGTFQPRNYDHLEVSDAFRIATLESLQPFAKPELDVSLTLYDGATPDDPIQGMYSFVPALPRQDDGPRFARPRIELPGIINPRSKQAASAGIGPRPIEDVKFAWESVTRQVLAQGLVLATRLHLPTEVE